jgi:hypothetical protein
VAAGATVRGVDLRPPAWEPTWAGEFLRLDLRERNACLAAVEGVDEVYHLTANMGGIGFIEAHKAEIVRDNTLIDTHMLEAARAGGVHSLGAIRRFTPYQSRNRRAGGRGEGRSCGIPAGRDVAMHRGASQGARHTS